MVIVLFLVMLVQKEIAGSLQSRRAQQMNRSLNIILVPLVFIVLYTIVLRLSETLR